jgi:hypothetical protein
MCLIDKKRFRFATENIPIYKVAILYRENFFSPYYYSNKLEKVNTVNIEDKKPSIFVRMLDNFPGEYEFGRGFFHAFTSINMARIRAHMLNDWRKYTFVVIKGYIPAGIRYAISLDETEICARQMILDI